ncbi:MAG: GH25 family lysozyme [Bacillota bacterium]|nr:GH25 family lysozyme [Bacillota bacterium]
MKKRNLLLACLLSLNLAWQEMQPVFAQDEPLVVCETTSIRSIQIDQTKKEETWIRVEFENENFDSILLTIRNAEESYLLEPSFYQKGIYSFLAIQNPGDYVIEKITLQKGDETFEPDFSSQGYTIAQKEQEESKKEAIERAEELRYQNWLHGIHVDNATGAGSPYWTGTAGNRYFYDGQNNLFESGRSLRIMDVSAWQKNIDWDAVKNSGQIDGVILRLGFSTDSVDAYFERNISECTRLGIPYGVYLFSYAENAEEALMEAQFVHRILEQVHANPTYPVYFDIEEWSYTLNGTVYHSPTSPSVYESMVSSFVGYLNGKGWNTNCYTYRNYLYNECNSPYIWSLTSWIAAYTSTLDISNPYYTGDFKGWQYTCTESIDGIEGDVDMSAFVDTRPQYESLEGYYLSLDNEISVNFCMRLSDAVLSDPTAYMEFTYPNGLKEKVLISQAKKETIQNTLYYVFPCPVSAKEMTDTIQAQLTFSEGTSALYSYSVEEYANYILNNTDKFDSKTTSIAKAMLTYGKYTQVYFGYRADHTPTCINSLNEYNLENWKYVLDDSNDKVDFVGCRLVLKSKPSLKLYFLGNADFIVDGASVSTNIEGKYTVITISDITDLSHMYTIQTDSFSLKYSVLSYGYEASNTNDSLHNLIAAMYAYYQSLQA